MIGSVIHVDGHPTAAALEALPALLERGIAGQVYRGGQLLQTTVRARASGRPGPRAQTGDYRRGISLERGVAIGPLGTPRAFSTVYTDSPQGQRLENGFIGVDSLGRHYRQPPYPHWTPAAELVEPIVAGWIAGVVDTTTRSVA